MLKKLESYALFIAGGIRANAKDGQSIAFIAGEIKAKTRRLKNGEIRRKFDAAAASSYVSYPSPATLDQVRVISLCHGAGTPEQKLSILSFLRYVGSPARWSVVSDGTINDTQARSLRALHPAVEVLDWRDFLCDENKACYEIFSKYTVFSKKFVVESNLPVQGATIYVDTDIVFFGQGNKFRDLLANIGEKTYYQRDLPGFLDSTYLTPDELKAPPLNAGFVVQGRKLDWSAPIARLKAALSEMASADKVGDLEKLEQSIAHMAHYAAGSKPLDDCYVLQISDRLDNDDRFAGPNIVMRHYVRPVRHKMWAHAAEYLH